MKFEIPENIRSYLEDESSVPLIPYKRSLWYHITKEEKASLVAFVASLDAMTRAEWEALTEDEKWTVSSWLYDAERIIRNSIIKEV